MNSKRNPNLPRGKSTKKITKRRGEKEGWRGEEKKKKQVPYITPEGLDRGGVGVNRKNHSRYRGSIYRVLAY